MSEIRCPHCGEVFQIDESNYAAIVQQAAEDVGILPEES